MVTTHNSHKNTVEWEKRRAKERELTESTPEARGGCCCTPIFGIRALMMAHMRSVRPAADPKMMPMAMMMVFSRPFAFSIHTRFLHTCTRSYDVHSANERNDDP